MRSLSTRLSVVAVALAIAVTGVACGSNKPTGTNASNIKQLPKDLLKGPYLGLTPARENITDSLHEQEATAYIDAVGLYSLRKGERLEATLQISKFSSKARPKDKDFQQEVASQIGGSRVQAFVMGGHDVYRSSARKQSLTAWFQGDYFMILAVRDTYPTPRSLLRVLLTDVTVS